MSDFRLRLQSQQHQQNGAISGDTVTTHTQQKVVVEPRALRVSVWPGPRQGTLTLRTTTLPRLAAVSSEGPQSQTGRREQVRAGEGG